MGTFEACEELLIITWPSAGARAGRPIRIETLAFTRSAHAALHAQNGESHEQKRTGTIADDIRPAYDLRGGVRGKYYGRSRQGTNVVLLDPDIAKVFKNSARMNTAFRRT